MRRVAMRYRGAEGLACPICAEEDVWTQLRNAGHRRRDDHRSPDGVSYEPIVPTKVGGRHLFPDDEPVQVTVKRGGFATVETMWRHRYPLTCPIHPVAFNREEAARHMFDDGELPADYWAREVQADG